MAVIETKYTIGDVVYRAGTVTVSKQHPCPDCKDTRKWKAVSPAGTEYDFGCPRCTSRFQSNTDLSLKYAEYEGTVERLTIGSVRTDSHSDRKVEYMCHETGVGSGSVYSQDDLFPDYDLAFEAAKAKAASSNVAVEWVAKLYDRTLDLSDYEMTSAERSANYRAHSERMRRIRDFWDEVNWSDSVDEIKTHVETFLAA